MASCGEREQNPYGQRAGATGGMNLYVKKHYHDHHKQEDMIKEPEKKENRAELGLYGERL